VIDLLGISNIYKTNMSGRQREVLYLPSSYYKQRSAARTPTISVF
jgi:hypothetical protein